MATLVAPEHAPSLEFLPGFQDIPEVEMPPWKRAIDVVSASIALIFVSPFLLLIALAVIAESPGGPFFRQARVGRRGRVFMCWKFRSMHQGAEHMLNGLLDANEANGIIFKIKDDPRRTRVGIFLRRSSLDELPQLWNVLRGDMSLVGPRPPTVTEVLRYDERHLGRLAATPGITGLWQVTLRRHRHDFADMVDLDIEYARTMSLALDIRIILKTIPTVLGGKGSY